MKKLAGFLSAVASLLAAACLPASAAPMPVCRVSQDGSSIVIENDLVTYVIAKQGALVTGIIDKASGGDIINKSGPAPARKMNIPSGAQVAPVTAAAEVPSPFCYFYTGDLQSRVLPVSAALEEDRLRVAFADGTTLDFLAEPKPGYIAFTLESPIPGEYTGLVFANSSLDCDIAAFSGVGCAMTWNVDMTYYPDAKAKHVMARVLNKGEVRGSKFAALFAPKERHRELLKAVVGDIADGAAAKSMVGGPYAMDSKSNYGDYMIVSSSATKDLEAWKATAAAYSIDQIDFHQGGGTFVQGSMRFTEQGSPENFRKNIAEPLREAGIQSGLHTYAHFISNNDEILTDTKWQRQLDVQEIFTLAEDVSRSEKTLLAIESTANVSLKTGFFDCNTVYLLVDREIMKFTKVGANGFTVERGKCGTEKTKHAAGAEIRHLGGMFGMFSPDLDSELFLQVARWTAQAYNEGGFGMIYLDALDGLWSQTPEEAWYYSAKFTNEIMKFCETDPMMECSAMTPGFWISRARMGAWDYPTAGYKSFQRLHVAANLEFEDAYLPTTLGWYHMYPSEDNTSGRFQFFDDIDHLGALSAAYDMGMVFNPAPEENASAAYLRNGRRFADIYSPLRKSGYFSEEAKAKVRENPDKEYAIVETSPGEWAFSEQKYIRTKLYDIGAPGRSAIVAENPFAAQKPFIRIEGHRSSGSSEGTVLLPLDPKQDLNGQSLSATLNADLSEARALRVKVAGNNSGDALCIRLTSMSGSLGTSSLADYIVRLDFEGAREFVLAEPDNGSFSDLIFPEKSESLYSYYREDFVYSNVTQIQVFLSGDCAGVRMSDIIATAHVSNAIVSPTIGGITFLTSIGENEYLEYFPGEETAIKYDGKGNAETVAVDGALPEIAQGAFEISIAAGNDSLADMPLRATVTLGFSETPGLRAPVDPIETAAPSKPGANWKAILAAGAGVLLAAGAVAFLLRKKRLLRAGRVQSVSGTK
ncbi:MAG: hypothetical protein FWC27_14110 [Firmicutes bacterium]|nr:hypothetical protein [Bacillota bacterium]